MRVAIMKFLERREAPPTPARQRRPSEPVGPAKPSSKGGLPAARAAAVAASAASSAAAASAAAAAAAAQGGDGASGLLQHRLDALGECDGLADACTRLLDYCILPQVPPEAKVCVWGEGRSRQRVGGWRACTDCSSSPPNILCAANSYLPVPTPPARSP